MGYRVCVFDAYGTLFDVNAAARQAAAEPGQDALSSAWPELAANWRSKQLQYTWLRAITGDHIDFWTVTQNGLDWALEKSGLQGDAALRARLLELYWELQAYAEVPKMLQTLKDAGMQTAILSNGSKDMLNGAVTSAGLADVLDELLSVDDVGIFKPAASVYQMVLERFKCTADEVLFVSSNGWDVAGATGFGFQTVWVNRAGEPMDRLFAEPHQTLSDLTDIPTQAGV